MMGEATAVLTGEAALTVAAERTEDLPVCCL
jgi:hypothetical protein